MSKLETLKRNLDEAQAEKDWAFTNADDLLCRHFSEAHAIASHEYHAELNKDLNIRTMFVGASNNYYTS